MQTYKRSPQTCPFLPFPLRSYDSPVKHSGGRWLVVQLRSAVLPFIVITHTYPLLTLFESRGNTAGGSYVIRGGKPLRNRWWLQYDSSWISISASNTECDWLCRCREWPELTTSLMISKSTAKKMFSSKVLTALTWVLQLPPNRMDVVNWNYLIFKGF